MRLYAFVNSYSVGVQAGIQAAHLVHEFLATDIDSFTQGELLHLDDWATNDQTIICLKGGGHTSLIEKYETLKMYGDNLDLPVSKFQESIHALNGAWTAIGIIVPPQIYKGEIDKSTLQYALYEFIKSHSLAN